MSETDTVGEIFAQRVAANGPAPLVTWYDDALGERSEISGQTMANWVAKTANLLTDGLGLGPGDRASLGLPPHWQTVGVAIGCWSAGLCVAEGPQPSDVAFVATEQATPSWPGGDRFSCGLHPLGMPARAGTVPSGYADFIAEMRVHGDYFKPRPVGGAAAAMDRDGRRRTHADLIAEAKSRAKHHGIDGGRVLIDADAHPDMLDWLLAPLVTGASIVLCRNRDQSRTASRISAERVTLVLT